jgi:hypothetical protein
VPVILSSLPSLGRCSSGGPNFSSRSDVMKRLMLLLIPLSLVAMSGCVVAPYGYHRGWYGPRVAVVAPAPVLVVR